MRRIQGVALGTVLCLALAGFAMASEAEVYTVGDFAVNLAKMVTNQSDVTAEEAAAFLRKAGVDLGNDLGSTVDEKLFVEALNDLGLNLTTSNPDRDISGDDAGQVFKRFDRNDTLFSGEQFKLCNQDDGQGGFIVSTCVTDDDCTAGAKCRVVQSIQCKDNCNNCTSNAGDLCESDSDCPGGYCAIPDGQLKKLKLASPDD